MKNLRVRAFIFFLVVLFVIGQFAFAKIDPKLLAGLKARSIGPANMSGRIGGLDVVVSNPNIIYVGAATGGLWKSVDGGLTWKAIFDDQPVASIGAIAINQSNPNIVWVGTGEATPRNSVGVGRGVYLTIDGGKTWKFLGLEKTEKVSKILLHPDEPDTAYVAALGTTWGENPERGVFKTVDGGKTWKKILFVGEKTGAADMAMDPGNPNKIIAGMWEHRRWPWFFKSGGPGSGLYMTTNGGEEWQKLTDKNGLPKGELGRMGIAFSTNKPEIVYALVEAKKSVLLRSSDGGFNWQMVNDHSDVGNRPFYYHRIWVNPVNENIVYMLHGRMMISEDGGKTFRNLTTFGQSHSDYHAMWIHPNGEMMVVGNDGGVVISYNRGQSWRFVTNLPIGQFYHVSFDMDIPYNVYGGLQDNGSWMGPAYVLKERAIYSYLWKIVGGGDGFDTEPDPEKQGAGYGMSQGGNLYYFDTSTGTSRGIVPTESDVKHRYHWNAGFAVDPFKPATIYLGSQFVHRSPDKGRTWEIISPDLTTNDPEKQKQAESGGLTLDVTNAENHTTILCIAPSPLKEGVIWVGTDDGNVQLTKDGGQTWQLVSEELTSGKKGKVPPATWVPHVEASKFEAATAYVVFDDHRRSNWTTYVYVTHDFGKTWESLATPELDGFVHVIEEDTVNKNLLFLGTEFGLYVSFNGGKNWMKWTHGVPTVAVRDLSVHPRENDLIIGTHGRSIYIIDDISPLREISEDLFKKKLHLFEIQDAFQYQQGRLSSYLSPGDTAFTGENKAMGACITYHLIPSERKAKEAESEQRDERRQRMMERMRQMGGMAQFGRPGMARPTSSRVKITVEDSEGNTVNTLEGTENKGINRVYWNLREQDPQRDEAREFRRFGMRGGLAVLPGEYTVKIKYDDQEVSQSVTVKSDPRLEVDLDVLKANYEMGKKAQQLSTAITDAGKQLEETKKAVKTVVETARANRTPKSKELMKAAKDLEAKLKELSETLNPTPPKQGIADRSAGLSRQVRRAVSMITRAGNEPISQAAKVKYAKVKVKADAFLKKFNEFYKTDVENFKKLLEESGFSLFKPFKPLELEK
ncbi:MAG: hypothetical protein GTO17_11170 [Candidatus Aminicenantes bacterium]|nr:hypothetical protein [Candidatus Aminicenantes bacterium]